MAKKIERIECNDEGWCKAYQSISDDNENCNMVNDCVVFHKKNDDLEKWNKLKKEINEPAEYRRYRFSFEIRCNREGSGLVLVKLRKMLDKTDWSYDALILELIN